MLQQRQRALNPAAPRPGVGERVVLGLVSLIGLALVRKLVPRRMTQCGQPWMMLFCDTVCSNTREASTISGSTASNAGQFMGFPSRRGAAG
jgi:hypothetical protein